MGLFDDIGDAVDDAADAVFGGGDNSDNQDSGSSGSDNTYTDDDVSQEELEAGQTLPSSGGDSTSDTDTSGDSTPPGAVDTDDDGKPDASYSPPSSGDDSGGGGGDTSTGSSFDTGDAYSGSYSDEAADLVDTGDDSGGGGGDTYTDDDVSQQELQRGQTIPEDTGRQENTSPQTRQSPRLNEASKDGKQGRNGRNRRQDTDETVFQGTTPSGNRVEVRRGSSDLYPNRPGDESYTVVSQSESYTGTDEAEEVQQAAEYEAQQAREAGDFERAQRIQGFADLIEEAQTESPENDANLRPGSEGGVAVTSYQGLDEATSETSQASQNRRDQARRDQTRLELQDPSRTEFTGEEYPSGTNIPGQSAFRWLPPASGPGSTVSEGNRLERNRGIIEDYVNSFYQNTGADEATDLNIPEDRYGYVPGSLDTAEYTPQGEAGPEYFLVNQEYGSGTDLPGQNYLTQDERVTPVTPRRYDFQAGEKAVGTEQFLINQGVDEDRAQLIASQVVSPAVQAGESVANLPAAAYQASQNPGQAAYGALEGAEEAVSGPTQGLYQVDKSEYYEQAGQQTAFLAGALTGTASSSALGTSVRGVTTAEDLTDIARNPVSPRTPDDFQVDVSPREAPTGRARAMDTEVDEQGNVVDVETFDNTGRFGGVQRGERTAVTSNNPYLQADVSSEQADIDSTYWASTDSSSVARSTGDGSEFEGSGRTELIKTREKDREGLGETQSQVYDFSGETETVGEPVEARKITDEGEYVYQQGQQRVEGQVGGQEFTGGQRFEAETNPQGQTAVRSASRTVSETETATSRADVVSEGTVLDEQAYSQLPDSDERLLQQAQGDINTRVDADARYGGSEDAETLSLNDLDENELRNVLDEAGATAQDIYGTDFSNFMQRLDDRSGTTDTPTPDADSGPRRGSPETEMIQRRDVDTTGVTGETVNRELVERAAREAAESRVDTDVGAGTVQGVSTGAATGVTTSTEELTQVEQEMQVEQQLDNRQQQELDQEQQQSPYETIDQVTGFRQRQDQELDQDTTYLLDQDTDQDYRQRTRTPQPTPDSPTPTPDLPFAPPPPIPQSQEEERDPRSKDQSVEKNVEDEEEYLPSLGAVFTGETITEEEAQQLEEQGLTGLELRPLVVESPDKPEQASVDTRSGEVDPLAQDARA